MIQVSPLANAKSEENFAKYIGRRSKVEKVEYEYFITNSK